MYQKIRTLVNEANMLIDFVPGLYRQRENNKGGLMGWLMISDKLITLVKSLCVLVGISFSLMLVALFLSMAWMALTSAGLVG